MVGGAAEGRLKVGDLMISMEGNLVDQLQYEKAIKVNTRMKNFEIFLSSVSM